MFNLITKISRRHNAVNFITHSRSRTHANVKRFVNYHRVFSSSRFSIHMPKDAASILPTHNSPYHYHGKLSFNSTQGLNSNEFGAFGMLVSRKIHSVDEHEAREINHQIVDNAYKWNNLLSIFERNGHRFSIINWATFMNRLGRNRKSEILILKNDPRYKNAISSITEIFLSYSIKEISNMHAVANIVHALAKLNEPIKVILDRVEEESEWIINNSKPQNISNTAWAFATLSVPAPNFFKLVDEDASLIIRNGTPQNISNTAWAFAKLSVPAPNFFKLVDINASKVIRNGKPQEISNTMWAFAELGYDSIHLPKLIDDSSPQLMKRMNSQDIANVALAFAKLDHKSNHYFNNLENNIDTCLRSMNNQDICNILWSLAILDLMDQNKMLLGVLWTKVISTDPSKFGNDGLRQLAQVHVHAKANSIDLKPLPTLLKSRINKSVWHADVNSSRSENEYSKLLQEIGFIHEREVSPFDDSSYGNVLLIDYACRDRMVAIEFDGSSHFLTDLKEGALPNHGKKNGATKAKRRLLKRLGWKFISISYMENIDIDEKGQNKAREVKKEYLKQKLRKVGVDL